MSATPEPIDIALPCLGFHQKSFFFRFRTAIIAMYILFGDHVLQLGDSTSTVLCRISVQQVLEFELKIGVLSCHDRPDVATNVVTKDA